MFADVTVVILTKNEEDNLPKALASVKPFARRIVVVDSGSTDRTLQIAREAGAEVYHNDWVNHAVQINWGIANTNITTGWTFRLDADEEVLPDLREFFTGRLDAVPADVDGIMPRRRMYFLGRWIRHGGMYPNYVLRLFRTGKGHCEMRVMDEHMIVPGRVIHLDADLKDDNTKSLRWWTAKHNWYSDRELFEMLEAENSTERKSSIEARLFGTFAERKRWLKVRLYGAVPPAWRSWMYFMYRYYILRGFLDGPEGRIYHFLQGYWYRFLVDAKHYEASKFPKIKDELVKEVQKSLG